MMEVRKEERRKAGFWGGFLSKVREFYWFLLVNYVLLVEKVYAQTGGQGSLVNFFCKIYDLMTMITYFLGPALGLVFVFMGIAKIRRKDDDPRAAGQGVWLIVAGIGCALSSIIFNALFGYFAANTGVDCKGFTQYKRDLLQ